MYNQPKYFVKHFNEDKVAYIIRQLLFKSIKKHLKEINDEKGQSKYCVMLSGGVDSTIIATIIRMLCVKDYDTNSKDLWPLCIVSGVNIITKNEIKVPKDVIYARIVSSSLRFKLVEHTISLDKLEAYIKKVIDILIAESILDKTKDIRRKDMVNISVGIGLYLSLEKAKELGCKYVFNGLGADEIFAGYYSHKVSEDVNQECKIRLSNLEGDIKRDQAIANVFNIKLLYPFLDQELVNYALNIPPELKIRNSNREVKEIIEKYILRKVLESLVNDYN